MIAYEIRDEIHRFGLTGVGRDLVNTVGSFVKTLADSVDRFGLAVYLRAERASDHISDDGARMAVRRRRLAGAVVNFNRRCCR